PQQGPQRPRRRQGHGVHAGSRRRDGERPLVGLPPGQDRHPRPVDGRRDLRGLSGERAVLVVYYSSPSEFTHRFVQKLQHPSLRLPLVTKDPTPLVDEPFVLITPTFGAGINRGSVPKQVIKFLNVKD